MLAERLAELIEATPHDRYVEPFVGMAGVFFRRRHRARQEVINDRSGEVANLFRVVQRHPEALMRALRWEVNARTAFDWHRAAAGLTDIERAARFLWMQITCFGGKASGRSFGARFGADPARTMRLVAAAHHRLAGVVIESLDWREVIRRYATPGTLFYLDPPYAGAEDCYGPGLFAPDQFAILADVLGSLRGPFVLSINGTPEMRAIFAGFRFAEVAVPYSLSAPSEGRRKRYPELIVTGP
jgi:DNA adenine methylase